MNVIQTEVVFPIAYTVMHCYFISKNLFPNHISYQDIQSTRKKKKNLQENLVKWIAHSYDLSSSIFPHFLLDFAPRQGN